MTRILAAVDRSKRNDLVVQAAINAGRRIGGRIDLLHVISIPPDLPSNLWGMSSSKVYDILAKSAREELEGLLQKMPVELRGELIIDVGVAAHQICYQAKERDFDLVILGAHGYGLVERTLGTTAAKVVNNIDRTVTIVRPRGEEK